MTISLTKDARKARSNIRKLLKSADRNNVEHGCSLLVALTNDPQMQPIAEELAAGCTVDARGILVPGEEVKKRVRAAYRVLVALWAACEVKLRPSREIR